MNRSDIPRLRELRDTYIKKSKTFSAAENKRLTYWPSLWDRTFTRVSSLYCKYDLTYGIYNTDALIKYCENNRICKRDTDLLVYYNEYFKLKRCAGYTMVNIYAFMLLVNRELNIDLSSQEINRFTYTELVNYLAQCETLLRYDIYGVKERKKCYTNVLCMLLTMRLSIV